MTQARVLHVFKYFRPRFTGEGIFVERLAPVFGRLRPDVVHDIAVTDTPRPTHFVPPAGLGTIYYLARGKAATGQLALVLWLARNARRYRTIHYHTHVDRSFLGTIMTRLQGTQVILSATLDDSVSGILRTYRPLLRPLVRRLIHSIGRFVAISAKLFEENRQFIPRDKLELVPVGVAIPARNPDARRYCREKIGLPPDHVMMVSVGGICPRKDQMFLVRQLAELVKTHGNLLLVLVGPILDAAYKAEMDAFIAANDLENNIDFAGYAEAPWGFYTAADIMVFASEEEGFGTAVIEAMAHGLPVVARHLPRVNDTFIQHGISGYLFTQAEQFQHHVRDLIASPALRAEIGAAGRAFVAAHFDISRIAGRYLALYGFAVESIAA
jgi:glycosyltransferase involved in cell wall biosynthesis